MAYKLIEKYEYPEYSTYSGRAEKCTFTMTFGPLASTGDVLDALIEHCESEATKEGAVMLGLEVWEESSWIEKKFKATAYAYNPGDVSGIRGAQFIIAAVVVAVIAIIAAVIAYFISHSITSVVEMDWTGGPVQVIRWGVYGIIAVGAIILGSTLLRGWNQRSPTTRQRKA